MTRTITAMISGAGVSGSVGQRRFVAAIVAWALLAGLPVFAAEHAPVGIVTLERPPFYHLADGKPEGFLLQRAQRVFEAAGVPVSGYEVMPPKRILAVLQQNASPLCSVGWFRNAERERYARYSEAIHVDRPHLVLTHRALLVQVGSAGSLLKLLDDPALRLGLVDGYSYGTYLDAAIGARHGTVDSNSRSAQHLVERLQLGRVDFVLMDPEEAAHVVARQPQGSDLVTVNVQGMPAGNKRYLICSLKVPESTMAALNRAIAMQAKTLGGDRTRTPQ